MNRNKQNKQIVVTFSEGPKLQFPFDLPHLNFLNFPTGVADMREREIRVRSSDHSKFVAN